MAVSEEEYKIYKEALEKFAEWFAQQMRRSFRQRRSSVEERVLLDTLREYDVPNFVVDMVEDLLKRAPPRRDKRGRPKSPPRPNLVAGHPRTLRRHKRALEERLKLDFQIKELLRWREETQQALDEYERERALLDNADKNSAN